ncbi:MAG TPA: winged helix-turn-helix domain-containing protein [Steroidobacteraceae bacterium]|nr:winged helix-turn-helix domain-containing protein [Steroidobacteraceae bacterium]
MKDMNVGPIPSAAPGPAVYRVDDLLIDTGLRRVTRDGVELPITSLSFELLIALIRAAPHLLSVDALMDGVWPGVVVSPETVIQRVRLLRQSLADSADSPRYIAAVRGHGYRMVATSIQVDVPVQGVAAAPSLDVPVAVLPADDPVAPAAKASHFRWRGVAVALALLLGVCLWLVAPPRLHHGSAPVQRLDSSAPLGRDSLAVLPFSDLNAEAGKDHLGDGMAEALINSLATVPGLKILARTSSFAYEGRDADIRQIAADLRAGTILQGSVRSTGERIRVSARLVDMNSGAELWSQTYDRRFAEVFKLQDDMAADVVNAMHGYLGATLPSPAARTPPTQDFEAYQLYLRAEAVGKGTSESEHLAQVLIDQALARDPNFAAALAYRAFMAGGGAALGYEVPASELVVGERDAKRALAISPGLPEAYASLGLINAVRGNWIAADENYRMALAAAPTNLSIRGLYSLIVLRPTGRVHQAYGVLDESHRLNPADGYTIHELALTNSLLGNDAEALKFMHLHDELGGGGQRIGNVLVYARAAAHSGHLQEAADIVAPGVPESLSVALGVPVTKTFYSALADPTKKPAARQMILKLLPAVESPGVEGQVRGFFMQALTMLDALDPAYELANRSIDEGLRAGEIGSHIYLADFWLAEMRPFRRDPRFQALVTRLKMIDYWKQYGPPDGCDLQNSQLVCR